MTTTPNERDREVAATFPMPAHGFTCFHCGETFTTPGSARDHFGFDPSADPACRIKIGAERGLVMALRRAERDLEDMRRAVADEATDSAKYYYAQSTRHHQQLMAVEEAGYEKGLADGRAEIEAAAEQRGYERGRAEPVNLCEHPDITAMRYLTDLRAGAWGNSVTILCDNEDADTTAEQMAIEVSADWTDYTARRFYGESILQCLAKAIRARAAIETGETNHAK
jgi:hypothetical protein